MTLVMEYPADRLCRIYIFLILGVSINFNLTSAEPKYKAKCAEYAKQVITYIDDPTGLSDLKEIIDHCVTVETLIHGGENATSKEFPFMALIGFKVGTQVSWKCGGTLISEDFVLSAAHCSYNKRVGHAQWVRLGELDISSNFEDAEPQDIAIKERIVHPKYNPTAAKYNDIALFRLERRVTFSAYVRPICLYGGDHIDEQKTWITGWGATENGTFSPVLQKANIKLISETDCKNTYNEKYKGLPLGLVWTTMVCAKGEYKDTCRGDSGGPLFISINNDHYCMMSQIGVTSFGKECNTNSPGIYTRVSGFIPWIESIVWPN